MMLYRYIKYTGSVPCSLGEETSSCIWETYFLPCDLLMQLTGAAWTIVVGNYPGIIPIEFGRISING